MREWAGWWCGGPIIDGMGSGNRKMQEARECETRGYPEALLACGETVVAVA